MRVFLRVFDTSLEMIMIMEHVQDFLGKKPENPGWMMDLGVFGVEDPKNHLRFAFGGVYSPDFAPFSWGGSVACLLEKSLVDFLHFTGLCRPVRGDNHSKKGIKG